MKIIHRDFMNDREKLLIDTGTQIVENVYKQIWNEIQSQTCDRNKNFNNSEFISIMFSFLSTFCYSALIDTLIIVNETIEPKLEVQTLFKHLCLIIEELIKHVDNKLH